MMGEHITDLIEKEELPIFQPKRYTSKFKESVREQWQANRKANKTMGNAEELRPEPSNFLKKNSRMCPQNTYRSVCCLSDKRPPIPQKSSRGINKQESTKNFLEENVFAIKPSPPILRPKFVDTHRGNVQQIVKSGLKPEYVFKKNFGHLPKYIEKRKKEWNEKLASETTSSENNYSTQVKLSEKERTDLLQGLKKKLEEKNKEFLLLPVIIDTPYLINYKRKVEKIISQLERDIKNIEDHAQQAKEVFNHSLWLVTNKEVVPQ